MPPLKIDLDDFSLALTAGAELDEAAHYLDTATGEVLYAGEGVEGLPADLRDNPRYRWIEPLASGDLLGIMESYADGLDDPAVAAWLRQSLQAPEPGPSFMQALSRFPGHREAWIRHQLHAFARTARAWSEGQGLEVEWT
ncbi:MAG: hypothetical protein EPO12_20400 [Aquabacterium sp.]|jgi:hypothetical protein|nr:MAG: hypothetical protein EPO12_20400 [Aquabacterium sp.]